MKYRNPAYINHERTIIDMEIDHPEHGWIEITITEKEYPEVWASVTSKEVPYNAEVIRQREQELFEVARGSTVMDRGPFCVALRNAGVFTQDDALRAARGEWIDFFQSALTANASMFNPDDAPILWAAMHQVNRSHDFVEMIRRHGNLTRVQMDAVFGLTPPAKS